MLAYVASVCLNNFRAFQHIVSRNNNFNVKPEWNNLFKKIDIFDLIQNITPEKALLEVLVLKVSLERDFVFMTELVLDSAILTPNHIKTLLDENQMRLLINLINRPNVPKYTNQQSLKFKLEPINGTGNLKFFDIIETALDFNFKSYVSIDLIKLMQNEVEKLEN